MRYGVREICNVVLKAKSAMKVGNKIFYANEPVIYFDTLKTSSLEGASTTVYAQGGRGNSRLIAWDGERTITFTMEDALISPEGFMILSGAGLVEPTSSKPLYTHTTETIDISELGGTETGFLTIPLSEKPYLPGTGNANYAYVMLKKDGEFISEPYIPVHGDEAVTDGTEDNVGKYIITIGNHEIYDAVTESADNSTTEHSKTQYTIDGDEDVVLVSDGEPNSTLFDSVLVDYYVERTSDGTQQIEITPDKFGGNFYLEASTLFRTEKGVDVPAEFIIPNCKIQSNFTFTMASSGDPSKRMCLAA